MRDRLFLPDQQLHHRIHRTWSPADPLLDELIHTRIPWTGLRGVPLLEPTIR
jgi:hypothetical protein